MRIEFERSNKKLAKANKGAFQQEEIKKSFHCYMRFVFGLNLV